MRTNNTHESNHLSETETFLNRFIKIEKEIAKAVIGQADIVRDVLCAMISGGNVLIEGMPGLGKTQLVKTMQKVLGLTYSRIQFTPDLMPADITGTQIIMQDEKGNHHFRFQEGPVFTNLLLADEINRATPKTQSALLEAMQEHTVTSGEHTHRLPEPFFVLATQNPLELEGTFSLPEAQMDRFMYKLNVSFPSKEELMQIMALGDDNSNTLTPVISQADFLKMQESAKQPLIAKPVLGAIMDFILSLHPDKSALTPVKNYVRYGPSPRGGQAIVAGAKIAALLDGRANVSYEDIGLVAKQALRHRIFLNFEAISDGITPESIIDLALEQIV